ncbi:hypothetical protein M8J76_000218 [Diaphorina citri]|nr:hypothetical protein M8J76_000218 [Diaphorina citri]
MTHHLRRHKVEFTSYGIFNLDCSLLYSDGPRAAMLEGILLFVIMVEVFALTLALLPSPSHTGDLPGRINLGGPATVLYGMMHPGRSMDFYASVD